MITKDDSKRIKILVVGLGGIGSQLTELVVPALSKSKFGVELTLMDGDVVEPSNLAHQRFTVTDLNQPKVTQLAKRYESLSNIAVASRVENLVYAHQLEGYDIVVVAVDRETPRNLVHTCTAHWVDLRCQGDGWLLLDNNTDESVRRQIPTNQHPVSCQMPGAIESGNIEFGFAAVAALGAQWVVQKVRIINGESSKTPKFSMGYLTYGQMSTSVFGGA